METLAAEHYWSAAAHELDRQAIFGCEWMCLGPALAVERPGSYRAETVAGWPVVVVRDTDGSLRAFHNVCRHRAGPLVDDGAGSCRSLVCRYHGWAYGLDGVLRSARDSGLDAAELDGISLFDVHVDVWRGLLFVRLSADGPPLDEWLGGLAGACAGFDLERWRPARRLVHHLACNWKTYGDNYLEGYHIPLVHPALAQAIDPGSYRVDVADGWARHRADTRAGTVATGAWLWHWPNLALNVYEHGMSVERWWPTGPRSCVLVLDFCFADTGPEAMERNQLDVDASAVICDEDRTICEAVQRNLEAGTYRSGLLSPRHEAGVADFQRRVRAAHRSPDPPTAESTAVPDAT